MSKILQKLGIHFHNHTTKLLKHKLLQELYAKNSHLSKNSRFYSFGTQRIKVTVVGAAGKVGQPLCLMLKQSPLIEELCVHDIAPTGGFALELNHVDTNCKVTAFTGKDNLANALQDSKIVVLLASAPDADMMSPDKMWYQNSQIVLEIMSVFAKISPKAFLAVGTNPINSIVPMCAEALKKTGSFNPSTLFGITSIDSVRANTFVAQCQGVEPECVMVPVIGGHSEETMVPVLSQAKPCADFSNNELENLTLNIRKAQDNILKIKPGEAAPLSTAFATARFIISLVKGIKGYADVVECAYVPSKVIKKFI
nr:unnamed protein product [Callosobruchus analis]